MKVCNSPGKACGIDINAVNYVCLLFVCLDVQSSIKERIRTSISLHIFAEHGHVDLGGVCVFELFEIF